jgi:integrase
MAMTHDLIPHEYHQGPRLWEACAAYLATVQCGPGKLRTYECWVEDLLSRYPLDYPLHSFRTEDMTEWSEACRQRGNAPATIYAKMSLCKGIFDAAKKHGYDGPIPWVPYPNVPVQTRWWLRPQLEREVLQWCWQHSYQDLQDFVVWTVETGLRIEETLRCTSRHFINLGSEKPELDVPGTKTDTSQGTIPISARASRVACRRLVRSPTLFAPTSYRQLAKQWQQCRRGLGILDRTATLKAMRRAFARKATVKGMPLPILQQAMRHKDPETTMGYMRLTGGGYTTDEMRKYL